jgi:hypothetical protein
MATINQKDEIVHAQNLPYTSIVAKVNAANVVLFYKCNNKIEIYNFKLELLHSFMVNDSYLLSDFHLKEHEIVFFYKYKCLLEFYNYKTKFIKKTQVQLNNIISTIGRFGKMEFFDLNDKFLLFSFDTCDGNTLYVFNRADFRFLYEYNANKRTFWHMNDALGLYLLEFILFYIFSIAIISKLLV